MEGSQRLILSVHEEGSEDSDSEYCDWPDRGGIGYNIDKNI